MHAIPSGHGGRTVGFAEEGILAAGAVLVAGTGLFIALAGVPAAAGVLAFAIFVITVAKPQFGGYFFLLTTPLIVGLARGDVIPILRPNEVLFLFIAAALATRAVLVALAGRKFRPVMNPVDVSLIALAVASSVLPIMLRYGRGLDVSTDDLLYAMVLWKYLFIYWIFRGSISTPSQVAACLCLSMLSAAAVAVVAILQVSNLFGVPELLHTYYDQPFEGHTRPVTARGTSTIASSFGVADVMIMNFVIAIALLKDWRRARGLLLALAGLFLSGCIVAGAFTGFVGLGVAVLAVGVVTGRLKRILTISVPGILFASVVFWPVVEGRLAGFDRPTGLPHSWEGRWENLERFIFPELFSSFNWLVGVRPAARLPAPEAWREYVYIESGYVWLLWIGGLPLLIAFIFFVWASIRQLWRVTRERSDAVRSAAGAAFAYLLVIVTLMLFDPHLTVRGSADLFFPLLALSFVHEKQPRHQRPPAPAGGSHKASLC